MNLLLVAVNAKYIHSNLALKYLSKLTENICPAQIKEYYKDLFAKGKLADSVIICTQDKMHLEPTRLAVECGYHILLEKPVATTTKELYELEKVISGYDKIFTTGFVLRYTPFIQKIKDIIKSGEIGASGFGLQ